MKFGLVVVLDGFQPVRDLVARLVLACRGGFRCLTLELQRLMD